MRFGRLSGKFYLSRFGPFPGREAKAMSLYAARWLSPYRELTRYQARRKETLSVYFLSLTILRVKVYWVPGPRNNHGSQRIKNIAEDCYFHITEHILCGWPRLTHDYHRKTDFSFLETNPAGQWLQPWN